MRNQGLVAVVLLSILVGSMTIALGDGGHDVGPCADTVPPTFGTDNTPSSTTTGAPFTFDITIMDNVGVKNASVEYWYGTAPHNSSDLLLETGDNKTGTYTVDITIPWDSLESLHYIYYATDDSDNSNSTNEAIVVVSDDQKPWIDDYTPSSGQATTGDPFTFQANVTDNIGVSEVRIHYMIGTPAFVDVNTTMELMTPLGDGMGTYVLNVTIPHNTTHIIIYSIMATDTHFNFQIIFRTATINDNDPPDIGADGSDTAATTGDGFHLQIEAGDNVAVNNVHAEYWYEPSTVLNVTMDPGALKGNMREYHTNITILSDYVGDFWYRFNVRDTSNVWNNSASVKLLVKDNDPPEVGPDGSHEAGEDRFVFEVNASDNVGVRMVWVVYIFQGQAPVNLSLDPLVVEPDGSGTYGNAEVTIPLDQQVRLDYTFVAMDTSGHRRQIGGVYINQDLEVPAFGEDGTYGEPIKGLTMAFFVVATDNFGLKEVRLEHWYGTEAPKNVSMTDEGDRYNLTINLPRWPAGDLHYVFHALDMKGNWNATGEKTLTLYNLKPVLTEGLVWEVLEGKVEAFDLTPHLSDGNDAVFDLVLETDAPGVTVAEQRLNLYYEKWMADHQITINISDGEDTVQGLIDVRVTNVNDVPIITSDPLVEVSATVAYTYQVEFTDEDVGDTHEFSFDDAPTGMVIDSNGLVTWTPAVGQEGDHDVDLMLNDGWASVHQYWTITVTKRPSDQPPGFTNQPTLTHTTGETYTYDAEAEDPDGDPITFSLREGPSGATLDVATGLLEWDPPTNKRDMTEDFAFVIRVSDGMFRVDLPFNVSLTYAVDAPPVITGEPVDMVVKKIDSQDLAPFMSDPDDPLNELRWEVATDSTLFDARMNGFQLVIDPVKNKAGKGTVTLTLVDPWGKTDTHEITVKVDAKKKDDGPGFASLAALASLGAAAAVAVAGRRRASGR